MMTVCNVSGWNVAKFLLTHERTDLASVGWCKRLLYLLKKVASEEVKRGKPLIEDVRFRDRIVKLEMDLMAHEWTVLRVLSSDEAKSDPGPAAAILKIRSTEFQQQVTELLMECAGPYALPYR